MKLRNHNHKANPNNYCRQYYTGCGIESVDQDGVLHVGVVTLVEPENLEAIMTTEPESNLEDEVLIPQPRAHFITSYFENNKHTQISKQKYLLYKLKGWNLP